MGSCVLCKKRELSKTEDDLYLEERFSSIYTGIYSSSLLRNTIPVNDEHNHALISRISRNKLLSDKGNVSKYKTSSINKINGAATSRKQTMKKDYLNAYTFRGTNEESKLKLKPWNLYCSSRLEPSDIRQSLASVRELKTQLVRNFKIDMDEKRVPIITFDPSNLILENKGKIMERYQIINMLGKGTFGEVHKIMHVNSKKLYAMKIINKLNYDEVDNIVNEIEILKSLVILLYTNRIIQI